MPLIFARKAFSYNLARFWTSFCCKLYNILLARMRISQVFFVDSFPIFFSLLLLSFSCPFLLSLSCTPISTERVLAWAFQKTWEWNIDQLGDLSYFTTKFAPKSGQDFFWYSSARIWSMFKMDTHVDGSVLAVLAAYQYNLVSSENDDVTSGWKSPDSNVGKIQLLTRKS